MGLQRARSTMGQIRARALCLQEALRRSLRFEEDGLVPLRTQSTSLLLLELFV